MKPILGITDSEWDLILASFKINLLMLRSTVGQSLRVFQSSMIKKKSCGSWFAGLRPKALRLIPRRPARTD